MHLKVFLKLKNPKNSHFEVKKPTKDLKKPKKPKKNHWAGFLFLKNPGFFPTLPCAAPQPPS